MTTAIGKSFVALLTLAATSSVAAGDAVIRAHDAWARRAPMLEGKAATGGSGNGAVYVTLDNTGRAADALIGAATDAARVVEVHETVVESGMAMMRPVAGIDVPAGKTVELKPGGYHLMLVDLRRALKPGDVVKVTLSFRGAGNVPVTATVR
jgi:periplasmic copper chaperone A